MRDHILAMSFPTLYPTGRADINSPRIRNVSLVEYVKHFLRYKDGRFGRHPRWRFLVFNIIMRQKARHAAGFYVLKTGDLQATDRDTLVDLLQSENSLLPQVIRQGARLTGTRPFWGYQSSLLKAQAQFLCPIAAPVFVTFSAADMQWHDLHRHLPGWDLVSAAEDRVRQRWIWQAIQDHPHLVADYLFRRFAAFRKHVLQPYFQFTNYWYRVEWQSRGSGHFHCLFWIPTAPNLGCKTLDEMQEFAEYWGLRITAINPDPNRQPDACNPASLPPTAVQNTTDQFTAFVNRLQRHNHCTVSYCLRSKKGSTAPPTCRFFFPRPLFPTATVTTEINCKSQMFSPARDDSLFNQCSPLMTLGWLANTDIQPPLTTHAVIGYISKYVSKAEKASVSYTELQTQVIPHINSQAPLLSFVSRMLNKLIGERDWSAQEVSHILLQLPVQESTTVVVQLDCRPENSQDQLLILESGEVTAGKSVLQHYLGRCNLNPSPIVHELTLFSCLRFWDWKHWKERSRARPRAINYFPRYSPDPQSPQYNDYCRVKLMLHHPFTAWEELLVVDRCVYRSLTEAYTACETLHSHPDDYYAETIVVEESSDVEPDSDDDDYELQDFELLARRRHGRDLSQLEIDSLGSREIDLQYSWETHIGRYKTCLDTFTQFKLDNPASQVVTVDPSSTSLNSEQLKLYNLVVIQYSQELQAETGLAIRPPQLLLNVDGVAGSGKTFTVLKFCARLAAIASAAGKADPVFRAAPTGVAAYNIIGKTIHSLLRLPVKGKGKELSSATLQSLQLQFQGCRFLVIDEKSMINLHTLTIIDSRLRAIFPAVDQPFGGVNLLLCGDFYQLPPVGGKALYSVKLGKDAAAIYGQQIYQQFNQTIRLTEVMRQQGEDNISVAFRGALTELRNGNLSIPSWQLLCTRVANQLTSAEVASFQSALRLYYTTAEVAERNLDSLAALNNPVKKLTARHSGYNAKKATEEEADNLAVELYLAIGAQIMLTTNLWTENGLVNGSIGTIVDISWDTGLNPAASLPSVVLCQFDTYIGPAFPGCEPGVVPVLPVYRPYDYKGAPCSRTQFPMRLAYAITVHKSQGLTLLRVVLNLDQREHAAGLSYVAVSRVKTLGGVMFERSFDYERFTSLRSTSFHDRELDFMSRTRQLL